MFQIDPLQPTEATGTPVQSSLRDAGWMDLVPGVETPGYYRAVPPGRASANSRKAKYVARHPKAAPT
jgi:hypothetical protein